MAKKKSTPPPPPPKGQFGVVEHARNTMGRPAGPPPPRHKKEVWEAEGLPPELADMRYVYYGMAEKRGETQGQKALRKLLEDDPKRFLDRYDELERQYAAANPVRTEEPDGSAASEPAGPPVAPDETAARVAARIEDWLASRREKALREHPAS